MTKISIRLLEFLANRESRFSTRILVEALNEKEKKIQNALRYQIKKGNVIREISESKYKDKLGRTRNIIVYKIDPKLSKIIKTEIKTEHKIETELSKDLGDTKWYKKYVSILEYCTKHNASHRDRKDVYAYTYEQNDTEREWEIYNEIKRRIGSACHIVEEKSFGYGQEKLGDLVPELDVVYPNINIIVNGRKI